MGNSLEERLQEHANTFDGLLSLIPAKYYYDEESNNQWIEKQSKKSKEEKRTNKRNKLNPEDSTNVSVKEILEEKEKTAEPVVLPGEKWKKRQERLELNKQQQAVALEQEKELQGEEEKEGEDLMQLNTMIFDDNGDQHLSETQEENSERLKVQKALNQSKQKKEELSPEEKHVREMKQKELKAKLQEKIQKLREKRKAPGSKTPGAAASRQQILEERRRKETNRKQVKKKVEEEDSSSSDDDSEAEIETVTEESAADVIFGNIEFNDGERVSSDLKSTRRLGKKKGPANNDIKAHLKKIEKEKLKLESLDKEAKKEIEEKGKWTRALAAVQGVKVKDDEKLLRKALRRKEAKKRKSETEWRERKQNVADEIKKRADTRDENLRIRKENRGRSKKDQIKHLPSYKRGRNSKKMTTKRAGFEGGNYKKRK